MSKRKFEVGQRVWFFNENNRVYAKTPEERSVHGSGPIYEKHFVEKIVSGIEGRSYVMNYPGWEGKFSGHKVSFKLAERTHYTDAEKDDDVWVRHHRYGIVRRVERANHGTLKKIAELVGYKPDEG